MNKVLEYGRVVGVEGAQVWSGVFEKGACVRPGQM